MFGFRHHHARPDTWVRLVRAGKTVRDGIGIDVWRTPGSTLVVVPVGLRETGFRCRTRTGSGNLAWLDGQIEWRFTDPQTAAARFDFTLSGEDPTPGDGLDRFEACLRREVRAALRMETASRNGAGIDVQSEDVARSVREAVRRSEFIVGLCVEIAALWLEDPTLSGKDVSAAPAVDLTNVYPTGVLSSHPLAEAWRREVSLLARMAPSFVGPLD
ncbi:MAG: hypothetical protein HYY18_12440 [Planctomycetes bacterium]|nr:hypothetical protein [Planctomycetota bacterium]